MQNKAQQFAGYILLRCSGDSLERHLEEIENGDYDSKLKIEIEKIIRDCITTEKVEK
jgi:hypothetical protein